LRKLLFIDNQGDNLWPTTVIDLFTDSGFETETIFASQNKFPIEMNQYECIFFSGSVLSPCDDYEWIHREHDLIRLAAEKNIPMLGSCFGSQILASALCGEDQVFRRGQCEVGYTWISLQNSSKDPILKDMPDKVCMFVWHNDEIKADHKDMVILGSSAICPNHIWRFKDKPFWGIQGHPELNKGQAIEVLESYRNYFIRDGVDIKEIIKQADNNIKAIKLIQNFIDYCKIKY
jgi:GMP synthase (glutamine-hydrolysing)